MNCVFLEGDIDLMNRDRAFFGPGGNSEAFYAQKKKSTLEAPSWCADIGLDAYEYEAGNGLRSGEATLSEIGKEAKKHGILMSYHTPYFISLSGVETEKRLKSINYIKESLWAAELLCAHTIVIHTGSAAKITREEAMALAADTLCRMLDEISDNGVKLGLETMGKINQLGTLDEVIALCKISPRLVPVVDFGHMHARELGKRFTDADSYRYVFERIGEELGENTAKYLHCHFSRIEHTASGEKKHLCFCDDAPYGPDFRPLMEVIAKYGYCPSIISESAGTQSGDALSMKKYYSEQRGK